MGAGRLVHLVALVALALSLPLHGARAAAGQPVEAPPYVLLPHDWPYPALPTCYTPYGICRYPHLLSPPGMTCYCATPSGGWVAGYVSLNPWYEYDVPGPRPGPPAPPPGPPGPPLRPDPTPRPPPPPRPPR